MPTKPRKRCTNPSCKQLHSETGGKCAECRKAAVNERSRRRPSPAERGYTGKHRSKFRPAVLDRDRWCVCTEGWCPHEGPCGQPSVIADHHPHSRKELIEMDLDPDDPIWGRGLCRGCDSRQTARRQPGGFNRTRNAHA